MRIFAIACLIKRLHDTDGKLICTVTDSTNKDMAVGRVYNDLVKLYPPEEWEAPAMTVVEIPPEYMRKALEK